jgi:hypothetical protein
MKGIGVRVGLLAVGCGALAISEAGATTTLKMNLDQLSTRSARILRGTVLSAKAGSLEVGGGQLPIVTYRVRVDEAFKGTFDEVKEGANVVEIRMVTAPKSAGSQDGVRPVSIFRDVPKLVAGQEYVLFLTQNSAVGLSTTVGLGQGCFGIVHQGKDDVVVNAIGNEGLFEGLSRSAAAAPALSAGKARGPMAYSEFAQHIRTAVAGKE